MVKCHVPAGPEAKPSETVVPPILPASLRSHISEVQGATYIAGCHTCAHVVLPLPLMLEVQELAGLGELTDGHGP